MLPPRELDYLPWKDHQRSSPPPMLDRCNWYVAGILIYPPPPPMTTNSTIWRCGWHLKPVRMLRPCWTWRQRRQTSRIMMRVPVPWWQQCPKGGMLKTLALCCLPETAPGVVKATDFSVGIKAYTTDKWRHLVECTRMMPWVFVWSPDPDPIPSGSIWQLNINK